MTLHPDIAQLVKVLGDPNAARHLTDGQWSALIATARGNNLLGALADSLKQTGVFAARQAQRHLDGALQLSARQHQSVLWEVHQLLAALGSLQIPVLLLKGAAYVISNHAVARGRLFGDIDLLVPRESLGNVESRLMVDGWVSATASTYDQRYYREWMHELPPMVHMRRGTVIDIHHTILPLTAGNAPDPTQIVDRSTPAPIPGPAMLRIPCPEDLVIHSLTHLVHEGELHNGLRDLRDIDCMLRDFGSTNNFWNRFTACAAGNDLAWPVGFGLLLAKRFFGTPVPDQVLSNLLRTKPNRYRAKMLGFVYASALQSANLPNSGIWAGITRWLVFVRAHALRMPLAMLVRHLTIKAWISWRDTKREPHKQ